MRKRELRPQADVPRPGRNLLRRRALNIAERQPLQQFAERRTSEVVAPVGDLSNSPGTTPSRVTVRLRNVLMLYEPCCRATGVTTSAPVAAFTRVTNVSIERFAGLRTLSRRDGAPASKADRSSYPRSRVARYPAANIPTAVASNSNRMSRL